MVTTEQPPPGPAASPTGPAGPPGPSRPDPRILIIRPSALGDVCRTVPLLASLRAAFHAARIDWLVQDGFADAVRHHPALDAVIPFPRRLLGRELLRGKSRSTLAFLLDLRARRYDIVIDAQGLARSAVFAAASGAPVRIGFADARECGWAALTHRVRARATHTVDRMLELLGPLRVPARLDLSLHADPAQLNAVDAALQRLHAPGPIVLCPTSRWPAKRWPAERWPEVARALLARGLAPLAVVGGPDERAQCEPLLAATAGDPRVIDLVGRTTVAGMMAWIARARLVIGNDSAAAHIAVGFDRPLVALFGPTDTAKVGPYARDADVIQHRRPGDTLAHKRPANAAQTARIGVREVLDAALARLPRA